MKLGRDGFWNAENNGEIQEMYELNVEISNKIPEPYRKMIGVEHESTAVLAWDDLVSKYMQQVEVNRADAAHCVATNLAFFVTGNYPVEISQRVMRLYPLCRATSFGAMVPMPAENPVEPPITDRAQLENIMDCEDRDWDYFARTDPTPKARDFVSSGDGGLYWPQVCVGGNLDLTFRPQSTGECVHVFQSDDNEPLTMEWVNSVRPIRTSSFREQGWPIGDSFCHFDIQKAFGTDKLYLFVCIGSDTAVGMIEVHTRGELRAICRALKTEVPK